MSGFPNTKFGICPFGGNSVEGTSGADAPIRDTSVMRQTLEFYPRFGRYLCKQCIKRLDDDERSLQNAYKHREQEEFLSRAGFKTSV
jgi:hypothetical protein